jgi:lipid-binding SYLF domain-containing protein
MALREAYRRDPTLQQTLERSAGYAVFPTVGAGGLIIGGGYGKGVVYEKGQIVGYCDMSSVSAGAKIGGKEYSEIIAFETSRPLAQFKNGQFSFGGDASAVALRGGSAASTQFNDNVAVFVYDQGGLMADASLGGQSFRFTPTDIAQQAASKIEGQETIDRAAHQERLNKSDTSNPDVKVDTNVDKDSPDVDVKVR